uniref:Uncharacterized protein LOC105041768 n=2 Tax=Elaeis guineensis var. tenera TaxID=51953 RepID=A0A6I9QZI3_ELAGV
MLFIKRRWRPPLLPPFPPPSILSSYSSSPAAAETTTSSSSPLPFMAEYLMDRLGYSKEKALVASKSLLHITTPDKPDAVLAFLRRHAGLSPRQLHAFVRRRPTVLATNVPSNLLPKLKLLERLLPSPAPPKDLAYL